MECIPFTAKTSASSKTSWKGAIRPIQLQQAPYEMEVTARGSSFHLIVGRHAYGNYVCSPDWDVGAELAALSDLFWNRERLGNTKLRKVDASSVACAIMELSRYVNL